MLSKRDLFELIQSEDYAGRRPVVLSDTPDALTSHTRGYGKENLRPGDYLESFARFVREQRNAIAALNTICTRPGRPQPRKPQELASGSGTGRLYHPAA